MKAHYLLSMGLAGILSFSACKNNPGENTAIEEQPIQFKKEGELYLIKPGGDTLQKLDVEIADNDYERATGLMYRKKMEKNRGMLFTYPSPSMHYFYMKNTYIPLDILFFDADSSAVSFQENAEALDETDLSSKEPAQFILEINAGLVEEWGIERGDKILFKPSQNEMP